MKFLIVFTFLGFCTCSANPSDSQSMSAAVNNSSQEINSYVNLSIDLLEGMKNKTDVSDVIEKIGSIKLEELINDLDTKQKKLAFWVNIYNGFVQYDLVNDPDQFKDKNTFYKEQRHKIAGIDMSFDNIEHGILRNSRIKLSLGYIKRWFVADWEKSLRNTDIDGRIHFALNCGAKSCPPVAIFNDIELESQLDTIVERYLKEYTTVEEGTITTSPLFSWFRGDFGGTKGIKQFLINHNIVSQGKYDLKFSSYDWTLLIDNYTEL